MKANKLQAIGETLLSIVTPDMTPKALMKAARKAFPDASRKDIVRAAFYSIITSADSEPAKARNLQSFALSERLDEKTA